MKKSIWILFGILVVSAWILGTTIQAGAETLKCKNSQTNTKFESMPVGDEEGHLIGMNRMEGLAYCENGEIAKVRSESIFDFEKGKGTQSLGYTFYTFEDGSTISVKFQRVVDYTGGAGSAKASSEIVKGTGRFNGIKGTSSGTGKNYQRSEKEVGRAFTDTTLTYTLPSK